MENTISSDACDRYPVFIFITDTCAHEVFVNLRCLYMCACVVGVSGFGNKKLCVARPIFWLHKSKSTLSFDDEHKFNVWFAISFAHMFIGHHYSPKLFL